MSEDTILIAVAGTEGGSIDQHFGQAAQFLVYEVAPGQARLVDRRDVDAQAQEGEDRRQTILRMLGDCRALLVAKVGVAPKEMLAQAGIDATADYADQPIEASLAAYVAGRGGAAAPAAPAADSSSPPDFGRFRLLHAMLRVSDLDRSLDFYTRLLGMRVIEQREHKKNQFTQVYLGYGSAVDPMVLELVFNWGRDEPYQPGDGFGHIAIAVSGIGRLCDALAAEGVPMPRPPRGQRHGGAVVAAIEDPDGYRIELIQAPPPAADAPAAVPGTGLAVSLT